MVVSTKCVTDGWSAGHTMSRITLPLPEDPEIRSKFGLGKDDGRFFSFMVDTKDVIRKTEMERDVLLSSNPNRTSFDCHILNSLNDREPRGVATVTADVIESALAAQRKEYNARMVGATIQTDPYLKTDSPNVDDPYVKL